MSDTYNPDEIVKCKHLNEFARQLRIKLDGGTDPKPTRDLTVKLVTQSRVDGNYKIADGTISEGVCSINFAYPTSVRLRVGSTSFETFDVLPQFVSECPVTTTIFRHKNFPSSTSTGAPKEVAFEFNLTDAQVGDNVTGTFHVPESASYAAVDLPIVINIIEEEG